MKYKLSLVLMATFLSTSAVYAADIDLDDVPEVAISGAINHWYGKVYSGIALADLSNLSHLKTYDMQNDYHWKNNGDINNAFLAGIGFGYRFNDLMRIDTTFEYRAKNTIKGSDIFDQNKRSYEGDISSMVFMANGYFDLGTFKNITPYVGAGIGTSGNRASKFSIKSDMRYVDMSSSTKWDMAWAAHAGFAVKLNPKMTLDIGYSYTDLGDAKTGSSSDFKKININHLTSNDIKIGLRYAFK